MKKTFLLCSALLALCCSHAYAKQHHSEDRKLDTCTNEYSVANSGYDVVAYFKYNEPRHGKSEYAVKGRHGITYLFSSEETKELFEKDPKRYRPQYGGFSAYSMAKGEKERGNPTIWTIVDGKLYLNASDKEKSKWEEDRSKYIKEADEKWEKKIKKYKEKKDKKDKKEKKDKEDKDHDEDDD